MLINEIVGAAYTRRLPIGNEQFDCVAIEIVNIDVSRLRLDHRFKTRTNAKFCSFVERLCSFAV